MESESGGRGKLIGTRLPVGYIVLAQMLALTD